jgi:microcystin-dependent protein
MAQIVDFSTTNSQVVDWLINVANSNAINLGNDLFYNKTGKLVVISTGAGGTGTVLTDTTDYTIGGAFADGDLPTSISPDVAYSTVSITNATYHNTKLFVSYYPISDLFRAERWNNDTVPEGSIQAYAGTSIPTGWLDADGSAINRTTYQRLFNAIGTTWGVGDGSTTFNLPDLQGAFLRGTGSHDTETKADGTAFTGPSVGSFEDDQMQQITGFAVTGVTGVFSNSGGALTGSGAVGIIPAVQAGGGNNTISFDSANSTAQGGSRTGDETRPFAAGVKYIIKY